MSPLGHRSSRSVGRWGARLAPLVLLAFLLAVWQAVTVLGHVPDFLLPGPSEIWQAGVSERSLLLSNALPTAEIAILGFLLALAFGFALAVAIRYSRILQVALYPIVI